MNNIIFFQHFHNGDLFVSKEYVRQVFKEIKNANIFYAHFNHPKTLKDTLVPLIGKPNSLLDRTLKKSKHAPIFFESKNNLFINTWCEGFYRNNNLNITSPTPHGINHDKMNLQWKYLFEKISKRFNTSLTLHSKEYYMPSIDYSFFNLVDIDKYLLSVNHKKKILISNGEVKSNQSFGGIMEDIITVIADEFKDINFYCTTKFNTILSNVYFTEDFIPQDHILDNEEEIVGWSKKTCDLNEISYFSKHCDIIIGRNSGPFVYCVTQENLNNPNLTFISFNKFEDDSLAWNIDHKSKYIWSNNYETKNMLNVIRSAINSIK